MGDRARAAGLTRPARATMTAFGARRTAAARGVAGGRQLVVAGLVLVALGAVVGGASGQSRRRRPGRAGRVALPCGADGRRLRAGRGLGAQRARGARNVWVAEGPAWEGRRVTSFSGDDGQEVGGLAISADGAVIAFVRGGGAESRGRDSQPRERRAGRGSRDLGRGGRRERGAQTGPRSFAIADARRQRGRLPVGRRDSP